MTDLKMPFSAAVVFHLIVLASVGMFVVRHSTSITEVTPIELVDSKVETPAPKAAEPKPAPVKKAPPAPKPVARQEVKPEAKPEPIKEEPARKAEDQEPPRQPVAEAVKSEPKEEKALEEAKPLVAAADAQTDINIAVPENIAPADSNMVSSSETKGLAKNEPEIESNSSVNNGSEETSFKSMVMQRIEKAKFYPGSARKRGYEGMVGVRFTVLPDGKVHELKIVRPCHCEILNKAACEAIEKAAPFSPRPKSMEDKQITMDIDLMYRLD